jgi:hypothetical protein
MKTLLERVKKYSLDNEVEESSIFPNGKIWFELSTGKSIDIGEHPEHPYVVNLNLTKHECKEIHECIEVFLKEYKVKFGKNEVYSFQNERSRKYLKRID